MPPAHRKQHGFVLYRSTVQIPWLWWGKGVPTGKSVEGLASEIDLAPTLLALAGVKGATSFDGVDLSAAVKGTGKSPRTEAYADTTYEGANRASLWTAAAQCQRDYGSSVELEKDEFVTGCFDRKADPDFTKPVKNDALAAKLDQMHDQLMTGVPVANKGPGQKPDEAGDEAGAPGADGAEQ
jgi:arylsulfatase A-like enzyme